VIEPLAPDKASSFVTFQRQNAQPEFSDADLVTLAALAPHLRRALRLHRRLAPQLAIGSTLMQLFQAAEAPMLLVGRDGTLVDHNPAAQAAISAREPLIMLRSNRLLYRFDRMWHDVGVGLEAFETRAFPALEITLQSDQGDDALLEVRRVHGAFSDKLASHAAVAVCTLRRKPEDFDTAFRQRHHLTRTEWKIVLHLTKGLSPAQTAAALGVQLTTVRTHVRSILVKTGTKRQAQLIVKILEERSASQNCNARAHPTSSTQGSKSVP
jgi:DNA-binding CsgD family transcriptional regulator